MDKDLLQQYKTMDTPQIRGKTDDKRQQSANQKLMNWMFNFLNSETH